MDSSMFDMRETSTSMTASTAPPEDHGGIDYAQLLRDLMPRVLSSIPASLRRKLLEADVRPECTAGLLRTLRGFQNMEPWALRLFDASGKYPTGLFEGSHVDMGAFDECLRTLVRDSFGTVLSQGQYCNLLVYVNNGTAIEEMLQSFSDVLHPRSYSLTCGTCRRRHLTILCELSRPVEGLPLTAESIALGRPSLPSLRTVTTAQSTHIASTAVLLQTGRIWAECGTRRLLVRVLLDSVSQRSCIREDAARKLQCSVVGREELSLITFGNSKYQRRLRAERVSVRLRSQFDDAVVELEALTIPEICSVTSPPLENNILQALIAKEYKAFPSEPRIIQLTTPSPAAGRWKRVRRQASMSTLILAAHVVVIGGRMGVTPHLRNFSQIGYFLCEHHDEDRIFEILHAEYIVIKHVKDALNAIRVGPKDGKGNSRAVCRLQKPAQERFERTAQKERKGRNSSFNGDVNEMEDKAQVNDLGYVPLFELLPISGEDTSVLSLEESYEASKLLVSTLGLEGTCMEPLQQSIPKTTKSISQRKRMPLEELESVEKMFDSANQPFHILPKLTEPGSCQVLPNMNCKIGMDTNVVHFYENNKNAVAEKAMNSSYVSLPQLINDFNNIGLMITDRPLKSSRYHWLSWKSIRPRRRLESKLDELQQLISSQLLLGSRHVSLQYFKNYFSYKKSPVGRLGVCFLRDCNQEDLQTILGTGALLGSLTAFSATSNTLLLLKVADKAKPDQYALQFLHGIRFFGIVHIVLGHCGSVMSDTWCDLMLRTLDEYYIRPYYHAVCYFGGCMTCLTVDDFRESKISKRLQQVGWCVSVACMFFCVFVKFAWYTSLNPVPMGVALFAAFFDRILWTLFLAWITLACCSGRGGVLTKLLSWNAYVPLSKLSFGVYLIHVPFLHLWFHSSRERRFWSVFNQVTLLFALLVWSFLLSYLAFLVCEAPTAALDKLVFTRLIGGRGNKQATGNSGQTQPKNSRIDGSDLKKHDNAEIIAVSRC
ncbi:hypothetical protein HPB52_022662 [Rhipicephalus sanguineus]|uniref:Nose resistant-to-fluoxetine protein N-terminal domain-containing protein n=1 Tax=Rhipicephalus sanguineus TaxID=34632 RepID=A0A9D4PXR4_RHISA|nr:hypothetical protein HPB52_022662 [Rhipicephalus sanguineus]